MAAYIGIDVNSARAPSSEASYYGRMTVYAMNSGGQGRIAVGQDGGTGARTLMHLMAARWIDKATAACPKSMQVTERVHGIARGTSIAISRHLSLIGVAPLLPAQQVSKPREMWVNDRRPGSPGLAYEATTGTGMRVRHCQLMSLKEEHMASDSARWTLAPNWA